MTTELQRQVLDLIDEDDYGMWEIGWRLQAVGTGTVDDMADVVQLLLDEGLAELLIRRGSTGQPEPRKEGDPPVDLRDPSTWEPRGVEHSTVWLGATDAGHVAYQSGQ